MLSYRLLYDQHLLVIFMDMVVAAVEDWYLVRVLELWRTGRREGAQDEIVARIARQDDTWEVVRSGVLNILKRKIFPGPITSNKLPTECRKHPTTS